MTRVRRLLPLLFVVVPAFAAHAVPGDVNGDGSVTLEDATLASRIASRLQPPTYDDLAAADVASVAGPVRDARVDWRDVTGITRVAGGLSDFTGENAPADFLSVISGVLTLNADVTRNYQFGIERIVPPSGVPVSGHVGGIPEGTKDAKVWFVRPEGSSIHGAGATVRPDGSYAISLPAGDYTLYFEATATEATDGGTYAWRYSAPMDRPVTISAPTTLDLTAPATPPTGTLTGSLDIGGLVATAVAGNGQPSYVPGEFTPSGLRATGIAGPSSFSLKVAPATYGVFLYATAPTVPSASFTFNIGGGEVAAGETRTTDLSVPAAVPVAFEMTPPSGGSVQAITLGGYLNDRKVRLDSTVRVPEGTTTYATVAPQGDYNAGVQIGLPSPPQGDCVLFINSMPVTVPAGGATISLTLPAPKMVTFQGQVTYPNGVPAPGARVGLSPYTDTSKPYSAMASTVTDANGMFSMTVPAATYQLNIFGSAAG